MMNIRAGSCNVNILFQFICGLMHVSAVTMSRVGKVEVTVTSR
jgi:hypothetical protein